MINARPKGARSNSIDLDGASLTPSDVWSIIDNPSVKVVVKRNLPAVAAAYKFLHERAEKQIIYGVNTGFGPMASRIIDKHNLAELQKNLVRSHASGAGVPIRQDFVLSAMVIRLNTLAKGASGVSVALLRQLSAFINHRIIPVVPEHGAVGTSGDLVQLAHIALALIGEGEVFYKGRRQPTATVLKKLKISPYTLEIKEGISLINGTSVMAGISVVLLRDVKNLSSLALRLGAFSLETIGAYDDSIASQLHLLRPHEGQGQAAATLRKLLSDSQRLKPRYGKDSKKGALGDVTFALPKAIQDVYSFRCIPQIIGPLIDTLTHAEGVIRIEINSATDNPLIHAKEKRFLHGGNFHGDYIATMIDQLKIPVVKSSLLSERRINYLLDEKVNGVFTPFLNLNTPGLTLGLQGLQFVATSTVAQNQTFAFPHSIHSISTNGSNQDVVSMGTDAALLLARVIDNVYVIFAIELIALLQAADVIDDHKHFSSAARSLYRDARKVSRTVHEDRSLAPDVEKMTQFLRALS